ncbi:Phenoxybenzoate dioxygenase subunit beta [Mycolicibacterium vanbaalenii]|uniref:Phenoxybenzoate dioxygenase subunit beta n=1 Tax=Mycolicibacterium vanbaalenii TaxID=110539 RepID=A0A5S9R6Z7_MYCVN|nr:PDR/VanB family oxidoreductase [Mycolicibacterium vanbaalenii]CAA0129986.1 Phenoxybenzoate dioxygenase subunit beta [Mycolicibacterium vanbaalenii]
MTTTNAPTDRFTVQVTSVRQVADAVLEVTFGHPARQSLPPWHPGAHIEIQLPSGLSRQYSLCGDASDEASYTIAVLREEHGRGGSRELHRIVCAGSQFDVRAPRNDFTLVEADSYLFVGGGIGITPLIPMINEVQKRGSQWSLVYGGRTRTSMAYHDRLQALGKQVDIWIESERGYPDLTSIQAAARPGTMVYACGPGAMIDAVAREFPHHPHLGGLHFERFAASGPIDTSGGAFEVELRRTGVTFAVGEGGSILQEVHKVLPDHPFSCEEGYCGECETRVLDGQPDHRDNYLTADEQDTGDTMMICVSRCQGTRLVLDL